MEIPLKGEVRRLSDVFSVGDAERASTRVQGAVQSQRHTLHTLQGFAQDNHELTKLVQDLPNKVSHNIMVPFGKAAFFPGRLVHTNEFLVLLGEGYYAECSAKKTLEILDRRGRFLNSQIAGVKSQLVDLDVESRFFSETLAEASAGLVEIREEFEESSSLGSGLNLGAGPSKAPENPVERSLPMLKEESTELSMTGSKDEDKEHELLMARLDELEAAEAAAEMNLSDEYNSPRWSVDNAELPPPRHGQNQFVTNVRNETDENGGGRREAVSAQDLAPPRAQETDKGQVEGLGISCNGISDGRPCLRSPGDLLKFEEWRRCNLEEGSLNQTTEVGRESILLPAERWEFQQSAEKASPSNQVVPTSQTRLQKSTEILRAEKAFTGSVFERSGPSLPVELPKGPTQMQKRPTSKFKMRQTDK